MDLDWRIVMTNLAEELIGIMREVDDEGIGAAARLDTRIQDIFDCFSCGEGLAADRMKEHLGNAKNILTVHNSVNFEGARRDMTGWHGDAANQFFDYLNGTEGGISQLVDRIDTLAMILTSYQALHLNMRLEVCDLVQRTRDGLAAAETDGWKIGAAIANAVVGVATGFVGGLPGGPAGAMIGSIAGLMVQGAIGVAIEAKGADSELGVLVEFVNSGEGMIRLIDGERARIETALRALTESITAARLPVVRPERPLVVTAPDFRPSTFGLTDQDQGRHPRPTDTRDLVPEPRKHRDGPHDQTITDGQPHDRYPEQGPA